MRRRGFTLVELMVAVAIMGMVMAIAVPNLQLAGRRARESALRNDLAVVRAAIQMFRTDVGCHPTQLAHLSGLAAPATCTTVGGGSTPVIASRYRGPYLPATPVDPVSRTAFGYTAATGVVLSSAAGNDINGSPYSGY
ncbi:MAG: prepilin-type N-terminal cleavage/methylation domain-containing protein [Fimbriimonadaceae bacterium]|nr:prepilin-type N-terminal cleavage/methylation domain-containing protein [Fimbriimonadaceae bacterium]